MSKNLKRTKLVHMMKVKYLLDMLKNNTLTFAQVKRWPDVYEAYLARYELRDSNGNHIPLVGNDGRPLLDQYYGQCWANVDYPSELLWSARCPDEHGVCIVSSIKKVKGIIKTISLQERPGVKFATVRYVPKRTLDSRVRTAEGFLERIRSGNDFLFEKRTEFQDEREYRIILDLSDSAIRQKVIASGAGDFCRINIDLPAIIDEIILDPRMSENEAAAYVDAIKKNNPSIQVSRSDIYQPILRQFTI